MKNFRAISAKVAQPNTPETDAMEKVLHKVEVVIDNNDKATVLVMSSNPMTAIEEVNKMSWGKLKELL
jgi:hypothetical protein